MAKNIEETFTIKIDDQPYHVTARNFNDHEFFFHKNGDSPTAYLNTDGLRKLGQHLIDSANKIDADPVFTPQK